MILKRQIRLCLLLAFCASIAHGSELYDSYPDAAGIGGDAEWVDPAAKIPFRSALDGDGNVLLAQADAGGAEAGGGAEGEGMPEMTAQCKAWRADVNTDIGLMVKNKCQPTTGQMSKLMDNPLGNVAMLFTQFDFYEKKQPTFGETDTQFVYTGIFQFPKKLSENWNLINRVIWTVPSIPLDNAAADFDFANLEPGGLIPPPAGGIAPINQFPGRTTGLGDSYYVALFSPSETTPINQGQFAWGLGFDVGIPTATEDILGTGKWLAGPSALAVYMGPKWKFGGLGMHYTDIGGSSNRADVNMTNIQYFLFYSLSETFAIGAAPNIIANWEQDSGNKWTVPIGIGFVTTVNIGKIPFRFGTELHYSVIRPDDVLGTQWNLRWYIIPAAPSFLFEWMQ